MNTNIDIVTEMSPILRAYVYMLKYKWTAYEMGVIMPKEVRDYRGSK